VVVSAHFPLGIIASYAGVEAKILADQAYPKTQDLNQDPNRRKFGEILGFAVAETPPTHTSLRDIQLTPSPLIPDGCSGLSCGKSSPSAMRAKSRISGEGASLFSEKPARQGI